MLDGMTRAFIALGSNLGDRKRYLQLAIERIAAIPETQLGAVAHFLETDAVDAPADSPAFLNSVVEISTHLSADQLMQNLFAIERELGRQRPAGGLNAADD